MIRYSWAKLEHGRWGVRASGDIDETLNLRGREVEVQSRDGRITRVRLGRRVDSWNAGRTSIYEAERDPVRPSADHGSMVAHIAREGARRDAIADDLCPAAPPETSVSSADTRLDARLRASNPLSQAAYEAEQEKLAFIQGDLAEARACKLPHVADLERDERAQLARMRRLGVRPYGVTRNERTTR